MKKLCITLSLVLVLILLPIQALAEGGQENTITIPTDNPFIVAELATIYEDDEVWKFELTVRDIRLRFTNILVVSGNMSLSNGEVTVTGVLTTKPGTTSSCSITAKVYRDTTTHHKTFEATGTTSCTLLDSVAMTSGTHFYRTDFTAVAGSETYNFSTPTKSGTK